MQSFIAKPTLTVEPRHAEITPFAQFHSPVPNAWWAPSEHVIGGKIRKVLKQFPEVSAEEELNGSQPRASWTLTFTSPFCPPARAPSSSVWVGVFRDLLTELSNECNFPFVECWGSILWRGWGCYFKHR